MNTEILYFIWGIGLGIYIGGMVDSIIREIWDKR